MTEILNIEYHTVRLMVKALNSSKTKVAAAEKLGISDRTLYNLMENYNIHREGGVNKSPKREFVTVKLLITP
ncbi:MAG: helix-turn-helix domain-containing protein [Pseudobacter sp.]|uniref:helix-turn-helix domain-containing protein n=1 Tax=Pseudobacter sp. TaxID=2045420 RepID=UPI003F7DE53B